MTLTSEQLSVVNLVSGRHLVLVPPGSGTSEMLSQRIVRALASEKERDHQAALGYFKAGMSLAQLRHEELRTAIGDFIYHRRGTLRLDAATSLAERGCSRWKGVVRGASKDFERLQSVADDEHEETIRTILMNKLPDDYERRLRAILFARARRKM